MANPFEKREYKSTGQQITEASKDFEESTNKAVEGAFLRSEGALSDADLEAAKDAVRRTGVVEYLYGGDLDKAIEEAPEAGGRMHEMLDGRDVYGAADETNIEYSVDEDYNAKDVFGWHSYDTEKLLNAVLEKGTNPQVDKLNEAMGEDGAKLGDVLKLMDKLREDDPDFDLEEETDYLGHGYIGPYAGSAEFSGNNGFEYINLTEGGALVRVGSGYASMDTEPWEYFTESAAVGVDSFLLAITEDPRETTADIFGEHSGSSDMGKVEEELGLLAELKALIDGEIEEPSDEFREKIFTADKEYREKQGQQNLFPEEESA